MVAHVPPQQVTALVLPERQAPIPRRRPGLGAGAQEGVRARMIRTRQSGRVVRDDMPWSPAVVARMRGFADAVVQAFNVEAAKGRWKPLMADEGMGAAAEVGLALAAPWIAEAEAAADPLEALTLTAERFRFNDDIDADGLLAAAYAPGAELLKATIRAQFVDLAQSFWASAWMESKMKAVEVARMYVCDEEDLPDGL